ncbi:MAG: hypothetical protein R2755_28375 [Acidimicrobiales bacterium]
MIDMQRARPIEILLVEDDPGDTLITREALEHSKVANELHCVVNGEDALLFLRRQQGFADAPRPDLILLDLNPPPRRARGAAGDQGRPRPAAHPGGGADHLAGRGGRAALL